MVLRDFYHHVYDRTGEPYGDAPARVEALYRQAVDQLRGGDRIAASRTLGLLSHYLSDSANPLHTDQTPAEKGMHSRYEDAVDDATDQPGAGTASLAPHTTAPNTDARGLTEQIAGTAHADYDALVSGFIADRNSPEVQAITERSLNAAVGGVADTIAGISADAGGERGAGSSAVPSLAPGLAVGRDVVRRRHGARRSACRGPRLSPAPAQAAWSVELAGRVQVRDDAVADSGRELLLVGGA